MTKKLVLAKISGVPARTAKRNNPALVYLSGLQGSGRKSMAAHLNRIAQSLGATLKTADWSGLRAQHVRMILTKETDDGKAPASVNFIRAGLRGVARAAWGEGQINSEDLARINAIKGIRGSRLPAGRALTRGELSTLFSTVAEDDSPAGSRDAAILALAYGGGLRRSELVSLDVENLKAVGETFELRVVGKGNKERPIYIDNGGAGALGAWLTVRGEAPGPLFWSGRKGGHVLEGQRMNPASIRELVSKRTRAAGLEITSPHDLRRSFVSDLLDAGVDISTVAGMAGHASVTTTARYDRRGEETKRKAAKALHVPWKSRILTNSVKR